jgi:hypothetical protein
MCAAAIAAAMVGLPTARAQNEPGALPPELAPLAARYHTDLDALGQARSKAETALRRSYLAELDSAAQKAAAESKLDELNAVKDEKETLAAGGALTVPAVPLLPHELAPPRAYLQREMARTEREYSAHAQQAASDYLRALVFFENKARMAKQMDLLQQIEAEKLKLSGQKAGNPGSAPIAARDLVINGDFALKKDDGAPETWFAGGLGKGVLATEQGTTFLRLVSRDKKDTWFVESAERPAGAQELRVTVRLRCRDLKLEGECGVIIAQCDGENRFIVRDRSCTLSGTSPAWKTLSAIVKLRPETKKLVIRCSLAQSGNTVDFADVHVEAR